MIRRILPGRAQGTVHAPPSKSYTHRALVSAFLSGQRTVVNAPLDAEDTRATARGLVALGARVERRADSWVVDRLPTMRRTPARVDCRESGTTLRFLTAVAALGERPVRFTGRGRLPRRPMDSLFAPLRSLGAKVDPEGRRAALPFTIRGPIHAGAVSVTPKDSSQPVSALLLALASRDTGSEIRLRGRVVSEPYIDATVAWMRAEGLPLRVSPRRIVIPPGKRTYPARMDVPGDASSAAYLWAAAAVTGGRVTVQGIDRSWPQADLAILDMLGAMGARVSSARDRVTVSGRLSRGVETDLTRSPDLYPLVGVLAALVPGERSRLRGAPHLRHKESDRLRETVRLARALGAAVTQSGDSVTIIGTGNPRALHLTGLTDHRLVMSAAVAALAGPGPSWLGDAGAVRKSFPGFWNAMARIRPRRSER